MACICSDSDQICWSYWTNSYQLCYQRSLWTIWRVGTALKFCFKWGDTFCYCSVCEARGLLYTDNILILKYPGVGANILSMALGGVVFFIVTLLLEQRFFIHKISKLYSRQSTSKAIICASDVRLSFTDNLVLVLTHYRILMLLKRRTEWIVGHLVMISSN